MQQKVREKERDCEIYLSADLLRGEKCFSYAPGGCIQGPVQLDRGSGDGRLVTVRDITLLHQS
jgi:hypothetical protein